MYVHMYVTVSITLLRYEKRKHIIETQNKANYVRKHNQQNK